jgi:hypothetical protein
MDWGEAKDYVAKKRGYIDYFHFSKNENCLEMAYLCDEAAEIYANSWTRVDESLPKKPSVRDYEHVGCNVFIPRHGVTILMWNCEHECWDDESGDDVSRYNEQVTHWRELPKAPK